MPIDSPPKGVTVEQSFDTLTITIPGTTVPKGRELNRTETLLKGAIQYAIPVGLFVFVMLLYGEESPEALMGLLGCYALTALLYYKLPSRAPMRHPGATVTLTPHHLTTTVRGEREEIPLDHIERVTVDAAGARMRVEGTHRYLLPRLFEDHRNWLGGVLSEAVERRAAGSTDAAEDHRRLARMLQQKQRQ